MLMLVIDDRSMVKKHKIIRTYTILKRLLKRYGRSISFPKNTDASKTYNWRFLAKFVDEFDKLELPEYVLPSVIEAVLIEANNRKLLGCGLAVLTKINILNVYHKRLERELIDETQLMNNIIRTHDFLIRQLKQDHSVSKLLIDRIHKRAYANITRWNQSGELDLGYIAISKSCKQALQTLDRSELALYPGPKEFIKIRMTLYSKEHLRKRLERLLGADLLEE